VSQKLPPKQYWLFQWNVYWDRIARTCNVFTPTELEPLLRQRWEDMLSVLAEQYGTMTIAPWFGKIFSTITGIIVGLLLLSAVNTAIGALVALFYMLARRRNAT
jgi:hypothetical protein